MKVLIFAKHKKVKAFFDKLLKSRAYSAKILPPDRASVTSALKSEAGEAIVFLEISGMEAKEIKQRIRACKNDSEKIVGILDPSGEVSDPAELFRLGVVDYIGKALLGAELKTSRLKEIVDHARALSLVSADTLPEKQAKGTSPSASKTRTSSGKDASTSGKTKASNKKAASAAKKSNGSDKKTASSAEEAPLTLNTPPLEDLVPDGDWKNVVSGRTYTFCFMFIELDLPKTWKENVAGGHLSKAKSELQACINRIVTPVNGKIWMWNEYGGVVLFPYDGTVVRPTYTATRMYLNRLAISCEDFSFMTLIKYRIALHIGKTVYMKRGNTGKVISDTVNFVFHLGQQFAEPGRLYITEEIYSLLPKGFQGLFLDKGDFEGRHIYAICSPSGPTHRA